MVEKIWRHVKVVNLTADLEAIEMGTQIAGLVEIEAKTQ